MLKRDVVVEVCSEMMLTEMNSLFELLLLFL
jgi:hypothetical protein